MDEELEKNCENNSHSSELQASYIEMNGESNISRENDCMSKSDATSPRVTNFDDLDDDITGPKKRKIDDEGFHSEKDGSGLVKSEGDITENKADRWNVNAPTYSASPRHANFDDDLDDETMGPKKRKVEDASFHLVKAEGDITENEADRSNIAAPTLTKDVIRSVCDSDSLSGKRKREDAVLGCKGPFSTLGWTRTAMATTHEDDAFAGSHSNTPSNVMNGTGEEDGVFDDAEEDYGFDIPTYDPSTIPVELKPLSLLVPSRNERLSKVQLKRALAEERVKRKRTPHQLNGKKETETAIAILAGKDDLLQVLSSEDCHFLANSLWIFTVQQLEAAIDPDAMESATNKATKRNLREELLQAIGNSMLVEDETTESDLAENENEPDKSPCVLKSESKNDAIVQNVAESESEVDETDPPLISLKVGASQVVPQSHASQLTKGGLKAAQARLKTWASLLSKWREEKAEKTTSISFARTALSEEKFPLDGPVSCLLPQGLQNFFATLKINSLSQFFSLRKTESGVVTIAFRKWRSLCDLPVVPDVLLSKHLLGITTRVEAAVTAVPWLDSCTRTWMGSEIVVLTGAAREFIVDECKIHDPEDFVGQKTKGLADLLEKWRETKNMPPLKGTGKVAMISGWKTNVKEELVIANAEGRTLHDVDLLELAELDSKDEAETKVVKKKDKVGSASKKHQVGDQSSKMDAAIRSKQFLKKVLGNDKATILIAAGIDTAEKLINADKNPTSDLVLKIVAARQESLFPGSAQPASVMRLLYDWTTKLRAKLEELEDSVDNNAKTKVAAKSPGRPPSKASQFGERARIDPSNRKDPIDALSGTARSFLASQNILSANDLLTTRTTDIAIEFVPWREAHGLPVLKGLGAIASVSGWKATVRKASAEMGLPDITEVTSKPVPNTTKPLTPQKAENRPCHARIEPMTHPELLFGKSSFRFAVRSKGGKKEEFNAAPTTMQVLSPGDTVSKILFMFEVSVRSSHIDHRRETVVLSYKGSRNFDSEETNQTSMEGSLDFAPVWDKRFNPILPILIENNDDSTDICLDKAIRDTSEPFSCRLPNCGIIELTKYGVFPLGNTKVRYEQLFSLKREITDFFNFNDQSSTPRSKVASPSQDCSTTTTGNTFMISTSEGKSRCFAYIKDPIEKGQVVELLFMSRYSGFNFTPTNFPQSLHKRSRIVNAIGNLAFDHVAPALEYLAGEILSNVTDELEGAMNPKVNYALLSVSLRKRRRLHWVASMLLRHGAQGPPLSGIQCEARSAMAKNLLWDSKMLSMLESLSDTSKTELIKILKKDVEAELVLEVAAGNAAGTLNVFTEFSIVSSLADECLRRSLDVVSHHLTKQDSNYTKGSFFSELWSVIRDMILLVMSEDSAPSEELELHRRPINLLSFQPGGTHEDETKEAGCQSTNNSLGESSEGSQDSKVCGFAAADFSQENGAVEARDGAHNDFPIMMLVTKEDLITGRASLNRQWYIENQIISVVHAVVQVAISQWPSIMEDYSYPKLHNEAYLTMHELSKQPVQWQEMALTDEYLDVRMFKDGAGPSAQCEPHTLPIFLGTVWRKLSKLGWRLEIGNTPDKVAFLPPGQATSNRKAKDARVKQIKQERARRRYKLAKEASETGLGYVPKLAKRLFANSAQVDDRESEDGNEDDRTGEFTVATALKKFQAWVETELPPDDDDDAHSKVQLQAILNNITTCFNQLAPSLVLSDEICPYQSSDEHAPSDVYGSEYLLRFLLVLPSILHETDVQPEQVQDTLSVVKDIVCFLAKNQHDLFDEGFCPPCEELQLEEHVEPFLAPKLKSLKARRENETDAGSTKQQYLAEGADVIVLPGDRPSLTNFVDLVMSQLVLCRATVDDAGKKNRRIQAGHPGLLCRHCRGEGGEGRYFFSTVESLTTAATVIEKHIARCPQVPESIKSQMVQYRAKHGEQRLTLQSGSLGAYYARLFDRLMTSKPCGDPTVYIKPVCTDSFKDHPMSAVSSQSGVGGDAGGESPLEFRCHIQLLEYIQRTGPWNNQKEIMEGLDEYYKCLEYGGRVYGTNAMPTHFSAEWVLSKVGPRGKSRFQQQSDE